MKTLLVVAMIQRTGASNRIEAISTTDKRFLLTPLHEKDRMSGSKGYSVDEAATPEKCLTLIFYKVSRYCCK